MSWLNWTEQYISGLLNNVNNIIDETNLNSGLEDSYMHNNHLLEYLEQNSQYNDIINQLMTATPPVTAATNINLSEQLPQYTNNIQQIKIVPSEHILFNIDIQRQNSCSICLEDFNEGEIASIIPCGHIFHTDCISHWLKKKNNCPNCRIEGKEQNQSLASGIIKKITKDNKENIYFGNSTLVDISIVEKLDIKHLKFLLNEFRINYKTCILKSDLINLIHNEIFYLDKPIDFIKTFLDKNRIEWKDCLEKKDILKLVAGVRLINRIYN